MARPIKKYRIRVTGRQKDDIDADLLMQALLLMAEEAQAERCEAGARRFDPVTPSAEAGL